MNLILISTAIAYYLSVNLTARSLSKRCFDRIKALESKPREKFKNFSILSSVGTTVFAIFLIQILPILFKIIHDLASDLSVSVVFSDSYLNSGALDSFERFSGLIAEAAGLLQQIAPLIAIFIGGYNLLSNLSRGMAAIKHD